MKEVLRLECNEKTSVVNGWAVEPGEEAARSPWRHANFSARRTEDQHQVEGAKCCFCGGVLLSGLACSPGVTSPRRPGKREVEDPGAGNKTG